MERKPILRFPLLERLDNEIEAAYRAWADRDEFDKKFANAKRTLVMAEAIHDSRN